MYFFCRIALRPVNEDPKRQEITKEIREEDGERTKLAVLGLID